MKKNNKEKRQSYSTEFKASAVELAEEIGPKEAAEKLGIKNTQTLTTWIKHSNRMELDDEYRDTEQLKAEIKQLKKELLKEKKVTAILKDATAFFCQDQLK
jgi:transposase